MSSETAAKKTSAAPKKATKSAADHPAFSDMVKTAIATLKERNGSSRQAILKYIQGNFKVGSNADTVVKRSLKSMVKDGKLVQTKGTGASGSFKLGAKAEKKAPKKKTAAAKPKKATTPKKKAAASGATSAAKKAKTTPKKKKAAAKPKAAAAAAAGGAAKKTASKAKPKAKATPKKSASAAKKPAVKKTPAAKKTAAKK